MKKFLCYIGCAVFTWGGLWVAVLAQISVTPREQGLLSFVAALAFCIALIFAGYGNSLSWKGKK